MAGNDINANNHADPAKHRAVFDRNGRFAEMTIPRNYMQDGARNVQWDVYGADARLAGTYDIDELYNKGMFLGKAAAGEWTANDAADEYAG